MTIITVEMTTIPTAPPDKNPTVNDALSCFYTELNFVKKEGMKIRQK